MLIAEHGASVREVRGAVYEWMSITNPNGYGGDACYSGGCDRGFKADGCGGMQEEKLVL